jgi:hypothetical protein
MTFTIIRRWIPLAFLATGLCALVYLGIQQTLRQDANNPQVTTVEDTASQLAGHSIQDIEAPTDTIDIAQSLADYFVIYDATGHPIMGDGYLDGSLPNLPPGVFTFTAIHGEDRFTWQPRPGVRQAVVIKKAADGFAMSGRSLREVEFQESRIGFYALATWFAILVGSLIIEILFAVVESRPRK